MSSARPAQHYVICPCADFYFDTLDASISTDIMEKLNTEYGFTIWPKFYLEKDYNYLIASNNNLLYKDINADETMESLYVPTGFCGDDMMYEFLGYSIKNSKNFTMIGYNSPEPGKINQIHSVLTFNVNKKLDIFYIVVDVVCVNNIKMMIDDKGKKIKAYRGAGYLLKTLIDLCISIKKISYITLNAVPTKENITFYSKHGFNSIGPKNQEGIPKLRKTETEISNVLETYVKDNISEDNISEGKEPIVQKTIQGVENSVILMPDFYEQLDSKIEYDKAISEIGKDTITSETIGGKKRTKIAHKRKIKRTYNKRKTIKNKRKRRTRK